MGMERIYPGKDPEEFVHGSKPAIHCSNGQEMAVPDELAKDLRAKLNKLNTRVTVDERHEAEQELGNMCSPPAVASIAPLEPGKGGRST